MARVRICTDPVSYFPSVTVMPDAVGARLVHGRPVRKRKEGE